MGNLVAKVGDKVVFHTPDNPVVHGREGVVTEVTEWGVHVLTTATKSGRFRAAHSELASVQSQPGPARAINSQVASGYTGDVCGRCGGVRMKRAGSCMVCEDCGDNSGCG